MQRRRFAQSRRRSRRRLAAVGMPAVAQSAPAVRWRMSTSWPKSLDTIYGSAEDFCKRVAQLTEGKFEIRAFPGGELVPAAQNMDAVSNGTVECNHVLSTAYIGKNTALTFDTGLSFGLSARQHNAWIHYGGGMAMLRALYKKYNIVNHVCGNVGVQMGGWYRKEIKSVADLKGLNMRIGGIGGMVLSSWARCRNRFLGRHLPGAGEAPSTRPNGSGLRRRSWASTRWRLTTIHRAGSRAARPSPAWCTTRPGRPCRRPIRPRSRPRRANRPCACWPTTTRAIRWRCAS